MNEKTRRIFIAFDISDAARKLAANQIQALKQNFPDLRIGWEKPEKIHLTLRFLGATDEHQLAKISNNLAEIAGKFAPFNLRIPAVSTFGRKVLFLEIEDTSGNLKQIYQSIENVCAENNFTAEKRDFKPHLTIARIREKQKAGKLISEFRQIKFEPLEFVVSKIVIYESILQIGGSKYRIIEKFALSKKLH